MPKHIMHLVILFLLVIISIVRSKQKSFDGFKVYRLSPVSKEQEKNLLELENDEKNVDFWNGVNNAGIPVDIMVEPKEQSNFLNIIKQYNIPLEIMIDDVQQYVGSDVVETLSRVGFTWTSYYKLEDIHSWMNQLPKENSAVSIVSAGKSYEGRDLKGVKVSFGSGKRAVFIEGGIHAREWIGPATVTYFLNEILNSEDPAVRKIANGFDWYFFPVINPDGYAFTHSTNRLWRKTRTPYGNCVGADPNRNWAAHWREAGTSKSVCSETYGGPSAFSEVETSRMADFIRSVGSSLDVYLSFHSYSQLMLIPYGHTSEHLDNYDDVRHIGNAAAKSLARKYGTQYRVGNTAEILYAASGTSVDWVKQEFKTPIAFTYELRDTGKYGFVLPADQIIPNCEEVMDSIITVFEEAEKLGYFRLQ